MQRARIGSVQEKIESVCCVLKRHIGFSEEFQEKINQQKRYKEQYIVPLVGILYMKFFYVFQRADTRICQPQRLTDAFIILFINHKDGTKRINPLF